jgi:hypothetical protein
VLRSIKASSVNLQAACTATQSICPTCQTQFVRRHRTNLDQVYCSSKCRQKAYRGRSGGQGGAVTAGDAPSPQLAAVTQFKVIAGPVENYSARSLRAAGVPLDSITAAHYRQLDRIRRETAWCPKRVDLPQLDAAPSDWRPCLSSNPIADDLSIPGAFLRRPE